MDGSGHLLWWNIQSKGQLYFCPVPPIPHGWTVYSLEYEEPFEGNQIIDIDFTVN